MLWTSQAETEGSVYHTSKAITTAGVDLQTMGKDFLWVGRAETRVKAFGGANKTAVGVTAARLVIDGFLPKKVPCFRGPGLEDSTFGLRSLLAADEGEIAVWTASSLCVGCAIQGGHPCSVYPTEVGTMAIKTAACQRCLSCSGVVLQAANI